jgi:hypothetical protein
MSLRFLYLQVPIGRPIVPLGGRQERPRPLISVTLVGPTGSTAQDALLDTGADDTIFPDSVATKIGIDLSKAPTGVGAGVGIAGLGVRYAEVTLRIADNKEQREWKAWVDFTSAPFRYPMLGHAGCLQYFTATFHGDREEVELTVNGLYPGT